MGRDKLEDSDISTTIYKMGSPGSSESIHQCRRLKYSRYVSKTPWRRKWQEDSLEKEMAGRLPGEGNGNPPQDSCLGNPTDRGASQATQSMGSQRVGHNLSAQQ